MRCCPYRKVTEMANNNALTPEQIKNFNKALEDRIIEANADQTKWKDVLADLMVADIFVVANVNPEPDANGNKQLNILAMSDANGNQAIPFFTSPARMSYLVNPERKSINCMKMKTIKLFQAIKGKSAVLNPNSNCTKVFNPFEMNLLVMENKDKA